LLLLFCCDGSENADRVSIADAGLAVRESSAAFALATGAISSSAAGSPFLDLRAFSASRFSAAFSAARTSATDGSADSSGSETIFAGSGSAVMFFQLPDDDASVSASAAGGFTVTRLLERRCFVDCARLRMS
jgi:hypothetical protein